MTYQFFTKMSNPAKNKVNIISIKVGKQKKFIRKLTFFAFHVYKQCQWIAYRNGT